MLNLQQTCFENIKTLCVNFNKDSSSRKTEDYLVARIESLESQWKDFETRHSELEQTIEDKNIKYFADNVFTKTKEMYKTTKQKMEDLLQRLRETKTVNFDVTGMPSESPDPELKELLEKQECNFKALDRVMSKIDFDSTIAKWELEDHLATLKSKWEFVDKYHWRLDNKLKGAHSDYYNSFVDIEDRYDELRRKLNTKIWSSAHHEKSAPKVEVPEFTGNYTQWISFKDLFVETIHNNPTINKAQKMQHLKTKLRGEAEKLVQHLGISADNYNSCWEILTQRYDNRRLQFTSFINTMLNLPVIQHPDSNNLKKMHDVITECLNGLSNIEVNTTTWDPLIVHLMSQKLDTATFEEYMKDLHDHRDLSNMSDFLYFLERKFMAYESMKNARKEIPNAQKQPVAKNPNFYPRRHYEAPRKYNFVKSYVTMPLVKCPHCKGNHVLMQCPKFNDMNVAQRNNIVAKLHVCENCLFSHGDGKCSSPKTCKECNMRHHTLLHDSNKNKTSAFNGGKNNLNRASGSNRNFTSNHLSTDGMERLLPSMQLRVKSATGNYVKLRALLDQGSEVSLIPAKTVQLLKLPRKRLNATVSGVGAVSEDCKGYVELTCKSIYSDYTFESDALIVSKLINNLPDSSFEQGDWPHLENLKLADPEYNVSRPVDLLLGVDVYSEIILDGVLRGRVRSPVAQQTQVGWILCGKLKTYNCHATLVDLDEITKYWEHEDIVQDRTDISKDDYCENHYVRTVQRADDGKYIVEMPLVPGYEQKLGSSKHIAVAQFLQLEKKLERKSKLALMYRDFIREYIDLGHMKPATPITTAVPEVFLGHHGVLREQSTTTKLRVVVNPSQRTSSGSSLNDLQEKGPNLQKDIQALILKWRSYKYAYTADIEKMYRCIWLSENQQKLQQIIWRDNAMEELLTYQLCTVTYGMRSAPWVAMRTLKQLAIDDGHKFPEAAHVLQTQFYMDDLLSGCNSLDEAKLLQKSLIDLLKGAGMNLRKWSANHPALLEDLTKDQISTSSNFDFKHEESTKTLGLGWNPSNDTFNFKWDLEEKSEGLVTKRSLLSAISKLYDPLGWLSPVTITAKLLFQKVWISKIGWDETLPTDMQNDWLKLKSELPMAKNFQINRWIGGIQNSIELLGFCDASERAYACVIYSRVANAHGPPITTLLVAKTRVAPLAQQITLPRLELCGALLLAQLMTKTLEAFKEYEVTLRAWCDSQVVLAWLQGDESRWERYVANRVTKIKQVIPSEKWAYIKSEDNPADCATRGLNPAKLLNFNLWWKGPDFLQTSDSQNETGNSTYTTRIELKSLATLASNQDQHFIIDLLNKCSSLQRVIRVTAWVRRFGANARGSKKHETAYLTTSELADAKDDIIKCVQRTELEEEYKALAKNKMVPNKSSIFKLNPYLDDKGIIRLGGRLTYSSLSPDMKNPVIVPHKGRFTQLLIEQAHKVTLHGGPRLTLSYLRQRYWIVGGNRAVKAQLRHCVRCHRYKLTENHQIMSDLPQQRITPSRPFTHTGVDFSGSVEVKLNKGRGVKTSKAYIAIFICMVSKGVHIELVSDLSTETFIAAFQRMCARRGTPKHMYSDCGTNFIGAAKVLRHEFENFRQLLSPEFFDEINKLEVEWHFNAPAWPTAGGLWEASVKSMKYHLRRVLGDQKLTYEEFTTLLTQIEACMNSRPLCTLTEDPEEFYHYLTPGHFLVGGPVMSLPLSDYSDARSIDIRRRWQLTENMMQQFWKSWSNEYLTQLQSRSKWNKPTKNIQEGDIVLVKDNNLPPGKWAMGRVLQVHPGSDGYVRVTTVKTQTGIIKRPVVKLSPLPLETETTPENLKKDTTNAVTPQTSKTTGKRIKKNSFSTLFTLLITMITLTTGAHGSVGLSSRAHITSLESDRPIYYDTIGKVQVIHNEWTLLMYYNLTNYWSNVQRIESYIDNLRNLCDQTEPRYCKTVLEQLSHEMELLNHYNSILLSPNQHLSNRKKRGLINGIGSVANSLFGILDQQFAEKYQKDIQALQSNENYLLGLLKNQTSIMEIENKVLKKTEDNVNRQFNMIERNMNQTYRDIARITTAMEVMMATTYFNSASLGAYLLLKSMRSMQEMLFDSLIDIYKGHMDVHLLSPVDLVDQLNIISGSLPKSLALPVEHIREDIKDFYKLLYVKARVTSNYFLFEVHVPLTSDEDFSLHKATPLPMKTNTETTIVQLSSQYVAVNFQKSVYISMTEDDVKMCTQLKHDRFICYKNMLVYNLQNSHAPCEAKLLSHSPSAPCDVKRTSCNNAWIALHEPNSWLAICCQTCTLRTICGSEVTSHTITMSSIVTLDQGCLLQSTDFTIYSHNEYNSKLKMEQDLNIPKFNSTINHIVDLSYHREFSTISHDNQDMKELDSRLLTLKEQEVLPTTMSVHDIHQYIISYILFGGAIIGFLVWVIKTRAKLGCAKGDQARSRYEELELQLRAKQSGQQGQAPAPPPKPDRTRPSTSANNVAFDFD